MVTVPGVSFAEYNDAIKNGNEQHLRITFPNKVITEADIFDDGIEYNEFLNSDTDLIIGKAVCSSVKIPLINDGSYTDFDFKQQFTVELGVDIDGETKYAPLGTFIGEKPKRLMVETIELIGYDLMTLFDADAKEYLTSVAYPKTIGAIFDGLCAFYGVAGNRASAINANRVIENAPFDGNGISGRDVLSWISEACGCYARMNRNGVCELCFYNETDVVITGDDYFDMDVMEFSVPPIDQVRVQVTENDIGVNYPASGTFDNSYTISDNPFLYATEASDISSATENLYNRIHAFSAYSPCTVSTDGNWLIQCGDVITLLALDDTEEIRLPIFNLSLNWLARAEITYESTGSEEREPTTVIQRQVIRQNYKYHEFRVELDEFESRIIASTHKTFVQKTDPQLTEELHKGDFWVRPGIEDWRGVKSLTWGALNSNYTWGELFTATFCWSGSDWIPVADTSVIAEQSSRISQTEKEITLEVSRANAAEGQLSSQINMQADRISLEVSRATEAEDELQSNIDQTAEDIRLGVKSAGKVETTGSYILIQDRKITVDTNGSIELRSGGAFTVAGNNFSIDRDGNVKMRGNVEASSGMIGGWYVGTDYIGNKNARENSAVGLHALADGETPADTAVIWAGNSNVSNANFVVKGDGSVAIKNGTITLGGTSSSPNFAVDSQGNITVKKGSINLGSGKFTVTDAGVLTATSGTVGGWKLGTNYIGNANTKEDSTIGLVSNATGSNIAIWAGDSLSRPTTWNLVKNNTWNTIKGMKWENLIPAPFRVLANGTMYSTKGVIGGWTIGDNSLTSTKVGLASTKDDSQVAIWAGNSSPSGANFTVTQGGVVTIKSGSIRIGGTSSSPNFQVDNEGNVTIKQGSINLGSGNFAVSLDGDVTIKKGSINIGNGNFIVDSTGNIVIRRGSIDIGSGNFSVDTSGNVVIKRGSIDIGSGNFAVDTSGNVTIKRGTIDIGSENFAVDSVGNVTIKRGSINIGNGSFSVDTAGNVTIKRGSINIGDGNFVVSSSGDVTIKRGSINIADKFIVTSAGAITATSATLTGTIYAKSGRIGATESGGTYSGGFIVTANKLYTDGKTSFSSNADGVYIGTDGIKLGSVFAVTSAGALTASSGQVGGWYIGTDYIGNKSTKASSSVGLHALLDSETASSTIVLWAGNSTASNANFQVKGDGSVVVKSGSVIITGGSIAIGGSASAPNFQVDSSGNVTIKNGTINLGSGKFEVTNAGTLTAKSGLIGGWTIGTKSIYNGVSTFGAATAGIYLGTDGLWMYKDATHSFKVQASNGQLTVMSGMTSVTDTTNTSGMFIGNTGIALGGGKFVVTNAGALTAKFGTIGGWTIGTKSIYNGVSTFGAATPGTYVGTDGLWIYKDATHSFKVQTSNGEMTVMSGMTSVSDTTNVSGMFIGSSGIALGGGKFVVTNAGSLTAKSGDIAGWTIGNDSLAKLVRSGSTVTSNVGMSSTGTISFYAGQSASADNCAFKVSKTGQVWMTKLYARTVDTSAPGYNEDDPSTWTWIDSQIDLGTNGFKIGDGYNTIAGYNATTGKVRLSNGQSFNTAASVKASGGWSGNKYAYRAYYLNSSGSQIVVSSGTSEEINAGWVSGPSGTFIHAFYGTSTAPYYSTIASMQYKLGFSTSTFTSDTRVQIFSASDIQIPDTASLALDGYWAVAWQEGYNAGGGGSGGTITSIAANPVGDIDYDSVNPTSVTASGVNCTSLSSNLYYRKGSWSSGRMAVNMYLGYVAGVTDGTRIMRQWIDAPSVSLNSTAIGIQQGSLIGTLSHSTLNDSAGKYIRLTSGGKSYSIFIN